MSNEAKTDRTLTGDEIKSAAADFENREFTPSDIPIRHQVCQRPKQRHRQPMSHNSRP